MSYHRLFHVTEPATPDAGSSRLYVGTDKVFKSKDDAGVVRQLGMPIAATAGQIAIWNGSEWVAGKPNIDYSKRTEIIEDWGANSVAGVLNWDGDTASSGSLSTTTAFPISTDKRYGKLRIRVSSGSTSRAGVDRGFPDISPGAGDVTFITSNFFTTEFFSPLNFTQFSTGLGNQGSDTTTGSQTDGIYFQVVKNNVFLVTQDGGVTTTVDTSVVLLSERWYRFEIMLNLANTVATFKVYETPDALPETLLINQTITTNLPPSTAQIGIYSQLRNTATGLGPTTTDVWQDYAYLKLEYPFYEVIMFIAFKTHATNPSKPEGMPNEWPWGDAVQVETPTSFPDGSGEWTILSPEQFEAYKVLHRPAYNAYVDAVNEANELLKQELEELEKRIAFGKKLMLDFKKKNISEGIQWYQALHLHNRIKDWQVTLPVELGSAVISIDLINAMCVSGDIETTVLALQLGQNDPMTAPHHWVTEERKQWLIDEMRSWLGWI